MQNKLGSEELERRCNPVFEQLLRELGESHQGWLVSIEPESGDYFLGQDDYEVLSRARKKHPKAVFFTYCLSTNSATDYLC